MKARAMEILVRQMNIKDQEMVNAILDQIQNAAHWRYRQASCRLLSHIGSRSVNKVAAEKCFFILERQTWDEPNLQVRKEIAQTLKKLKMAARASDRCTKKLEDKLDRHREEAVTAVGTLGLNNEKVVKSLLDILELDASVDVRLRVIKTIVQLGVAQPAVVKSLQRAKGTTASNSALAMEAAKALKHIQQS